jgi:hypothetical protein
MSFSQNPAAKRHHKRAALLLMEHDLVAPPIFVGIVASRDQPGE